MAFQKSDGTSIANESALKGLATHTSVTVDYYEFPIPVYKTFSAPGTKGERFRKLMIPAGAKMTGAELDALFPAASITSISQTTIVDTGLVTMTIKGQNLSGTSAVTFGGTAGTELSVVDNETIKVKAPAHAAGVVDVVVTDDSGAVTKTGAVTYVKPGFTSIAPTTGAVAGGTNVTITGTNLRSVTGVTFGGTAATNVHVVSDTQITCTTPAHASGAVALVLQYPNSGTTTAAGAFTYA